MWILWKIEILEMWILWKNEISEMWIVWKMRFWNCEFGEKWDFEIVNFVFEIRRFLMDFQSLWVQKVLIVDYVFQVLCFK